MAPMLLRSGKMSADSDVYSFGIMMWELFTGACLNPRRARQRAPSPFNTSAAAAARNTTQQRAGAHSHRGSALTADGGAGLCVWRVLAELLACVLCFFSCHGAGKAAFSGMHYGEVVERVVLHDQRPEVVSMPSPDGQICSWRAIPWSESKLCVTALAGGGGRHGSPVMS